MLKISKIRKILKKVSKSGGANTRNFEAGLLTDEPELVRQAMQQFDEVWMGLHCSKCLRRKYCGDPIA